MSISNNDMVERRNLVFLYGDEGVIDKPFPEFQCKDCKYPTFGPLQDGFVDEPRYRDFEKDMQYARSCNIGI